MIIIFQNNQITAVDKKLLQILDCTLNDIGEKISQLDLALNSLQNNEIQIENQIFSIKKIEIISMEDFHIYELQTTASKTVQSFTPLEESFNSDITPSVEKTKTLEEEFSFNVNPIKEAPKETFLEESCNLNIKSPLEEKQKTEKIKCETSENLLLETEPKEISIIFDDEFEEIEKILSLNNEKAKKLILEDLEKAANDFEMDIETIKELYSDLINQIETNKSAFYNAIKAKDYEQIHKISHSLKGASLNLRLSNLAIILKTIDEKSKEKISFDKLEFLVNNFYTFVNKVKTLELETNSSTPDKMPAFVKELILETIKNYVETQNEKKLKKDLKYIEKLLNTKINSIEELQSIVKGKK